MEYFFNQGKKLVGSLTNIKSFVNFDEKQQQNLYDQINKLKQLLTLFIYAYPYLSFTPNFAPLPFPSPIHTPNTQFCWFIFYFIF